MYYKNMTKAEYQELEAQLRAAKAERTRLEAALARAEEAGSESLCASRIADLSVVDYQIEDLEEQLGCND